MRLAIFDFDGTLFTKETLPFILKYWKEAGFKRSSLYKTYWNIAKLAIIYKLKLDRNMDKRRFRTRVAEDFVTLFEGMTEDALTSFFDDCALEMEKHFYKPVVTKANEAKATGYHTVVCSGNYVLSLQAVAKYVPFDTIIGTELAFDEKGLLDISAPPHVKTGDMKKTAILEYFKDADIDWTSSVSYGDSYYDADVMELTGNPVAVRPDSQLEKIAKEKGWEII